ncbi:MAG: site-specific DNA-methyltransferase [Spirochaetales bacterium]|nr:site-specific DNA-methyltransferase [Spirochaetales bacterium]
MLTKHGVLIQDARDLENIGSGTIDLVVTSPPYPMIRMWDSLFSSFSPDIAAALDKGNGNRAFDLMHAELDKVWQGLFRVLKSGGFACINAGDAVRTVGERFRLYSNHSRITQAFVELGFDALPVILWRKTTNAPNKFMGSGMLPAGAYVTLEHEYILIFRKGPKREFSTAAEKENRMQSAVFWEERNRWFSDVWDIKGMQQKLDHPDLRDRSASYPLELPYRLINMYSVYGDMVLDPFTGTGTTLLACMACARNSLNIEIESSFLPLIIEQAKTAGSILADLADERVSGHDRFVAACGESGRSLKYGNKYHGFPVMTRQETEILLYTVKKIDIESKLSIHVEHGRFERL